jgi:hypothetical protein
MRYFAPDVKKRPWLPHEVPEDYAGRGQSLGDCWPPATEPRAAEELYHVASDPWELQNLAGDPAYSEIKADLAGRLNRWMTETDDHVLRGEVPERPDEPGFGW